LDDTNVELLSTKSAIPKWLGIYKNQVWMPLLKALISFSEALTFPFSVVLLNLGSYFCSTAHLPKKLEAPSA
jgi:hypothetical protein